jgi:hypothetical protein
LEFQKNFEANAGLLPGIPGDFSSGSHQDEFRSVIRRDAVLRWSDELGWQSHRISNFFVSPPRCKPAGQLGSRLTVGGTTRNESVGVVFGRA